MKTLTTKFIIEYGDDVIESDEYEYECLEENEKIPDDYNGVIYDYEEVLEQMENDKIAWVFDTLSIRHEIISNE